MKKFLAVLAFTVILFPQDVVPKRFFAPQSNPAAPAIRRKPGKSDCADQGTYVNSKGEKVRRPENCSEAPHGATAQCRDGTYSFSRSHRGTCSHHGGVGKWLTTP